MEEKNRIKRVLVAIICLLSLVLQSFSGFTIESKATDAAEGTYQEYTLSDAGIEDQEGMWYGSNPDIVAGTLPENLTDGMAFNVKIKFEDTGAGLSHASTYLRIGSLYSDLVPSSFETLKAAIAHYDANGAHNWYGGLCIAYENGKILVSNDERGNEFYITAEDLEIDSLLGVYLKIRLTFDLEDNDTIMNMTVSTENGEQSYTHRQVYAGVTGFGDTISARSNTTSTLSLASVVPEEPEQEEYQEYTLSDAGIADTEGLAYYSSPAIVAGTLPENLADGVAFNGKLKFEDAGEEFAHARTYLRIGSSISTLGSDLVGNITNLDGNGCHSWYGGLCIAYENGKILVSNDERGNEFYITAEDLEIDSLLGVYLKIRLTFDLEDNDTIMNMTVSTEDEVHTYTHRQVYTGVTGFGDTISARSNSSNKLSIVSAVYTSPEQPDSPEQEEYTEYTFSDAGIANQSGLAYYSDPAIIAGTLPKESLDGVAFNGKIKFEDTGEAFAHTRTYLRLGSTLSSLLSDTNTDLTDDIINLDGNGAYYWYGGIRIAYEDGKIFVRDDNSDSRTNDFYITAEDLEIDSLLGVYFKIRLTFDVHDNDMILYMSVSADNADNIYTHKQVYRGLANAFGNTISARSNSTNKLSLLSVVPGEPEEPQLPTPSDKPIISDVPRKELSEYKEFTFSSILIQDQTVSHNTIIVTIPGGLNGKVFKGNVTFPADGAGVLRLGGNANNAWFGLHVDSINGGLRLFDAATFEQTWIISKDTIGKDITNKAIDLYITFDYVDESNVYIGVYVDGKFCGERLYQNLPEPFGEYFLIHSPEAEMKIASIATAWQRFLASEVNLEYFGFSNTNWKEELIAKNK